MGVRTEMTDNPVNSNTWPFVEEAYHEASTEALDRGQSMLTAHKEGVVAAAMLLAVVIAFHIAMRDELIDHVMAVRVRLAENVARRA